jgi:hypothetical protein
MVPQPIVAPKPTETNENNMQKLAELLKKLS